MCDRLQPVKIVALESKYACLEALHVAFKKLKQLEYTQNFEKLIPELDALTEQLQHWHGVLATKIQVPSLEQQKATAALMGSLTKQMEKMRTNLTSDSNKTCAFH